jgi:hypothetical protein
MYAGQVGKQCLDAVDGADCVYMSKNYFYATFTVHTLYSNEHTRQMYFDQQRIVP